MADHSHITVRKRGFLSSLALGLSAVIITITLSGTAVTLYTVHLVSEKTERVVDLAQSAIRGLPELQKSLPPAVADMLDDRRQPDYSDKLKISARLTTQPGREGDLRTAIEVVNNGPEVVSAMSLRVIILDKQDRIIRESHQWAATPFTADSEWRGPIMPGSRRYFTTHSSSLRNISPLTELKAEVEITELRLWNRPEQRIPIPIDPQELEEATASAAG